MRKYRLRNNKYWMGLMALLVSGCFLCGCQKEQEEKETSKGTLAAVQTSAEETTAKETTAEAVTTQESTTEAATTEAATTQEPMTEEPTTVTAIEETTVSNIVIEVPSSSANPTGLVNPKAELPADGLEVKSYSGFVVIGNSAFETYDYVDSLAENYAKAINLASDRLRGTAQVYDILVPLSIGVSLPDSYQTLLKTPNEGASIEKIFAKVNADVRKVNFFNTMMAHREEYLYFRTDHHWTALGAFYAYDAFCQVKGIKTIPLSDRQEMIFPGYHGSFCSWSKQDPALTNYPDTVYAYKPVSQNTDMLVTKADGGTFHWPVVNDVSGYKSSQYGAFIAGDNPLSQITNPDIADDSSCVVIKESFGNAFVPYLVDHYHTVYVVDYRYFTGSLIGFVTDNHIQDVIFINYLTMTRGSIETNQLNELVSR